MHPPAIQFNDSNYSLLHLRQSFQRFDWTDKTHGLFNLSVRVRYSNHCYSKRVEAALENDVVIEENPLRVFCPERHARTPNLVMMIEGLFAKPTSTIHLTTENNWHIFRLYGRDDPRYCVFFQIRANRKPIENQYRLDLYVESAYPRGNMVKSVEKMPFGTAAMRVISRAGMLERKKGADKPLP